MRQRERFLFTNIEPGFRSTRSKLENLRIYCVRGPMCSCGFYVLIITYIITAAGCAMDDEEEGLTLRARICSGPDSEWSDWSLYFPAMLNTLTAFLLVFYLSQCYTRYQSCVDVCQDLKKAVIDVMLICVGTIGDKEHCTPVLMEFWRTLNLVHLTAYEGKDTNGKGTGIFSFAGFVLPVASAFGVEEFGMLTRDEVEHISRLAELHRSHVLYHQLLFSRLYRLAQTAIAEKWTSANWPVWQNAFAGLRSATERLMHHATMRVPEIYVIAVSLTAFITMWTNFVMLGAGVGAAIRFGSICLQVIVFDCL